MNTFSKLFSLFFRNTVKSSRAALIILGSVGAIVLAITTRLSSDESSLITNGTDFISIYGSRLLIPILVLLIAGAILAEMYEDETIVFVWLSSVSRLTIAGAAIAASTISGLLFICVPLCISAIIATNSAAVGLDTLIGSAFSVAAYSAIFTWLGIVAKKSTIWGILYIILWEWSVAGALGALAPSLKSLSVLQLTDSIIRQTAVSSNGNEELISTPFAILGLLITTAIFTAVCTHRVSSMDVA